VFFPSREIRTVVAELHQRLSNLGIVACPLQFANNGNTEEELTKEQIVLLKVYTLPGFLSILCWKLLKYLDCTLFHFTRWLSLEPFTRITSIAIARRRVMNEKSPGKSVAAIFSQLYTLKDFLKDILGLCKLSSEYPSHLFCRAASC